MCTLIRRANRLHVYFNKEGLYMILCVLLYSTCVVCFNDKLNSNNNTIGA